MATMKGCIYYWYGEFLRYSKVLQKLVVVEELFKLKPFFANADHVTIILVEQHRTTVFFWPEVFRKILKINKRRRIFVNHSKLNFPTWVPV